MSKFVRLENEIAAEIVMEETYTAEIDEIVKTGLDAIEHWYGKEFASKCVEANDDVVCGMLYNRETNTFYFPVISPKELRKQAYATEEIIEWENDIITVDEANKVWLDYSAEGNSKAEEIQPLIIQAKEEIRVKYPDEI